MDKIRVIIADDHPVFREGLCRLIEDEEDLEIVGKSADGQETVTLATELKPDVVLIDVAMPQLNGIEAAKQIKEVCPSIAILMLSAYEYESYILASLQAGVSGYLLKDMPFHELVSAIRFVHLGESVFDFRHATNIVRRLTAQKDGGWGAREELHAREIEVLKLAAKGITNREIANELIISERTVQSHLVSIFKKLEVSSRTEAVIHALKLGWLTLDDLP